MKRILYSFLLFAIFSSSSAQEAGPLFKPSKITFYYPPESGTGWELSFSRSLTYNQNGDVLVAIHNNADGVPTQKDSLVYSSHFEVLENHRMVWEVSKGKFVPYDKVISSYDLKGNLSSTLVFRWTGIWDLQTGTENVRSFDSATKEETEVTKTYDKTTDRWSNLAKVITSFDALDQKKTITLYSADNQQNFQLFSRQNFNGWHNYSKQIETGQTTERYVNGTWVQESTSTTVKNGSLYQANETRFTGPTAGTYRTFFAEDNTYREFFKQSDGGWLGISVFTKDDTLEKAEYNSFQGDLLTKIQVDERETDANGSLERNTTKVRNAMGVTISFSEVLHEILYDNRNLPLEDVSFHTQNELVAHKPAARVVYSDYVDVRITTELETVGENQMKTVRLYPNPGIGVFTVSENVLGHAAFVFNTAGSLVKMAPLQGNKLDISDLPAGVYQLHLETGKGTLRQKVVVVAQ